MNVCPQCGTTNRPEARFCRQCRSALSPVTTPTCPHCGAPLRPGARFCKQCGKPIAGASAAGTRSTCPRCGAPVRASARFCSLCCAPLVAPPGTATGPRCPNCGTLTRSGARFCHTCRRPLGPTPSVAPSHPLPPPHPLTPPSQQPGRFGTGKLLPLTILAGRYMILEKIAQGGMGAVYKAQDRRLQNKIVAVKEMSESAIVRTERTRVLKSFQREAELLARLEHPNLARVTDRIQEGERHYIVMEFIEGQTLRKMLEGRSEPFPEEQVLVWADQLCDVLSYLHSREPKIIYRDMKPANVMVLDGAGSLKLIDFGIARFFKPGKRRDTIEFGTAGYSPPEQYGKSQTDERADIYALGVVLHQLLTLRDPVTRPFNFPPVRSLNPKVSRRAEAAIAKAVEANKDKRHQSMEELWKALLGGKSVQPRPAAKKSARAPEPAAPPVPGAVTAAPATVDFSRVMVGGRASDCSLVVNLPAGEQAAVGADTPWLQVHPQRIGKSSSQVTITLDTTRLKPGRLQLQGGWLKRWAGWHARFLVPAEQEVSAHVEIESKSGHRQRVPVSVTVVPRSGQVQIGWIMTIGAMLLEAAAVIVALAILVMMAIFGSVL